MNHPCAQPLRIEPATFFIKGPFWRGALLMLNTGTTTLLGGLMLLQLFMRHGQTSAAEWWWRLAFWLVPPLTHFFILKIFVEGKPPHYAEDRTRWMLRLRVSLDHAWPHFFPLLPRLVPEAEIQHAYVHQPSVKGRQKRYYEPRRWTSTHPLLRL